MTNLRRTSRIVQPATSRFVSMFYSNYNPHPEFDFRRHYLVAGACAFRCAPSKARRFLSGASPDVSKPSQ